MKKSLKWFFAALALLLVGCNPLKVSLSPVDCNTANICNFTVTNNENSEVQPEGIEVRLENQGVPVTPIYNPLYNPKMYIVKNWERGVSHRITLPVGAPLQPDETRSYNFHLPKLEVPGQTLVDVSLFIPAPNIFSSSYGRYHKYAVVEVPGEKAILPFEYKIITCTQNTLRVLIKNHGGWGYRQIGIYLNGNLKNAWRITNPRPDGTDWLYTFDLPEETTLVQVDVNGLQEQPSFNPPSLDYHGARSYCVPTQ